MSALLVVAVVWLLIVACVWVACILGARDDRRIEKERKRCR